MSTAGLLALCRGLAGLTDLRISTPTVNIGGNKYCDEGAVIAARHLPRLQTLWALTCELGWEAAAAVSNSLPEMETLYVDWNRGVQQGCATLGRLPRLKQLFISSFKLTQATPEWQAGQSWRWPSSSGDWRF